MVLAIWFKLLSYRDTVLRRMQQNPKRFVTRLNIVSAMVAEPSVQVLTTALARISSGTDNIGIALTTLKQDIEGESALLGMNFNTKVFEGINIQITSNFEQVKQVIEVSVEMAKNIDKLIKTVQATESEKLSYAQITAGVSEQFATMFSKMPSRRILPFATQFRATPPARQRFFWPLSRLMLRASFNTTSSVTA